MNGKKLFFNTLVAICILGSSAAAQLEPIGPLTVVGMQPIDFFFINDIPPNPDRKVLDFLGEATNFTGTTVFLDVVYDWIDVNGMQQFSPTMTVPIPPGGPFPVDPGPFTLDFCPQEVSLHFTLDVGEISLQGEYGHFCFPVPEPSSGMLAILAAVILARCGINPKP